jgi:hypothetical protein
MPWEKEENIVRRVREKAAFTVRAATGDVFRSLWFRPLV